VAIFTFTPYDDDRAYDMKLGGLFFTAVLLWGGLIVYYVVGV
jgi:hypothetical protein